MCRERFFSFGKAITLLSASTFFFAVHAALAGLGNPVYAQQSEPYIVSNSSTPEQQDCRLTLGPDLTLGVLETPEEQSFGSIVSYAVAADGTIYILDALNHSVVVFNANGDFVTRFGRKGRGPGEFELPYRMHVSRDSEVLVLDAALSRISRFSLNGEHIDTYLIPFHSSAQPFLTTNDDGSLFVTGVRQSDLLGGDAIHQLNRDMELERSFGFLSPVEGDTTSFMRLGSGPVVVDSQGRIWFTPLSAYEIHRYTSDGNLEMIITRQHDFEFNPGPFVVNKRIPGRDAYTVSFDINRALSIALEIDQLGRVWHFVRDAPNGRMVLDVFSQEGRFLQSHTFDLVHGPKKLAQDGHFYSIAKDKGFPQLIRYEREVSSSTSAGRQACSGAG